MLRSDLPRATWLDILWLIPHAVWVYFAALWHFTISFVFGPPEKSTTFKQTLFAVIRTQLRYITLGQELLFPRPRTAIEYERYFWWHRREPHTTVVKNRLSMHWIGPTDANKIVLYFHGGGYFFGASPLHFMWLSRLQQKLCKPGCVVSIVIPSYTLTPEAAWPQQLHDATDALRYLVEEEGRRPRDIIIGGDSAGGHLTVVLLSHMLHPLMGVPPLTLKEPLATVILMSPFVRCDLSHRSWITNYYKDYIPHEAAERWTDLFLGDNKDRNKNNTPGMGDTAWFKDIDKLTNGMLIWAGADECLVDGIKLFNKTMQTVLPKTKLIVEDGAVHIEPILDVLLKYGQKTEGTRAFEEWCSEHL